MYHPVHSNDIIKIIFYSCIVIHLHFQLYQCKVPIHSVLPIIGIHNLIAMYVIMIEVRYEMNDKNIWQYYFVQ